MISSNENHLSCDKIKVMADENVVRSIFSCEISSAKDAVNLLAFNNLCKDQSHQATYVCNDGIRFFCLESRRKTTSDHNDLVTLHRPL